MNKPRKSTSRCDQSFCEQLEPRRLLAVDLVATGMTVPVRTITDQDTFIMTAEYRNDGDFASEPFDVQVRLSTNRTIGDSDDVVVGSFRRTPGLNPGQTATTTRSFALSSQVRPGSYFVGFVVDNSRTVEEGNENNNSFITDDVRLTVTGVNDGQIEVRGNDLVIQDGDARPAVPDGTAFGQLRTDAPAVTHSFTIFNRGTGVLQLFDVALVGRQASSFVVVNQPTSTSIDPGESVTFQISFDPSTTGMKRTTVQISSSDESNSSYSFDIVGRGRPAGAANITVAALGPISDGDMHADTSDGTNFGTIDVGSTVTRTFTITNTGSSALNLTGARVQLAGRNPRRFTIVNQPRASIAAGQSAQFTIRFTAAQAGIMRSIVQILSNDPDQGVFDFQIQARGRAVPGNG